MKDTLGDRMKMYENAECARRLLPLLPVIARIDGRAFHTFTKGMKRPFDETFSSCMVDTTIRLVSETNACIGYTQSDEITLAWHSTDIRSQIWFDGRISKMTSLLAAQATLYFNKLILERMPKFANKEPLFDARVWTVPNRVEGCNAFIWREWDATKNSISMAAAHYYSEKALHKKNSKQKQEMLFEKGINWDKYPPAFKRGTYVQRHTSSKPYAIEDKEKLPPKHKARTEPEIIITRTEWTPIDMPILTTVTNLEQVIFEGAKPLVK